MASISPFRSGGRRDTLAVLDGRAFYTAFPSRSNLFFAGRTADGVTCRLALSAAKTRTFPSGLEDVAGGFIADRVTFASRGIVFLGGFASIRAFLELAVIDDRLARRALGVSIARYKDTETGALTAHLDVFESKA